MSILIAAYLQMCECGEHGHFVLSSDQPSREFCSKDGAYQELRELLGCEKITKEELVFLRDCVYNLSIPSSEHHAGALAQLACEVLSYAAEDLDDEVPEESPSKHVVH